MSEDTQPKTDSEATEKIRAVVEKYAFVRKPGMVLAHLQGKIAAFIAAKIEEDINGRFKDLPLEELDLLFMAVLEENDRLSQEQLMQKQAAAEAEKARLEAEKAAIKEKKQQNRAERRKQK